MLSAVFETDGTLLKIKSYEESPCKQATVNRLGFRIKLNKDKQQYYILPEI